MNTDIVKKYYDLSSAITYDANVTAIGEMQFGAALRMIDFIVITFGTRLDSGIVVNGQLVYRADGFAGEFCHTIYNHEGRYAAVVEKAALKFMFLHTELNAQCSSFFPNLTKKLKCEI